MEFFQANKVEIESELPVHSQMDGETDKAVKYQADILPGALKVRV